MENFQHDIYIYTGIKGHIRITYDSKNWLICSLEVEEEYRNKGIGTSLIKEAERIVHHLGGNVSYLYVKSDVWQLDWYKRLGYTITDNECEEEYLQLSKKLK